MELNCRLHLTPRIELARRLELRKPFSALNRDRAAIQRGFLGGLLVPAPHLRFLAKILVTQDGAAASRWWIESERTCFDSSLLGMSVPGGRLEIMLLTTTSTH